MILRRIVIPLIAAYALFVFMALSTLRRPSAHRTEVEPAGWRSALRYLATTVGGGYLFFLLVVLTFHDVIAGQHGVLAGAARGGSFLAFVVAAPAFLLSMWWSSRR
jgi:Family of unknown function (DUF6256)